MCRFVGLLLVTCLLGLPSGQCAQPITQQDLLDLTAAGISPSTIIKRIEMQGVAFDATPSALANLRSKGVSPQVLESILTLGQEPRRTSPGGATPSLGNNSWSDVQQLYRQGKFAEAADLLERQVRSHPQDLKARASLVVLLLKLKENAQADKEFAKLRDYAVSDADIQLLRKVEELQGQVAKEAELRAKITGALSHYRGQDAVSLVETAQLDERVKKLLLSLLSAYGADYANAKTIAQSISTSSLKEQRQLREFLEFLSRNEEAYRKNRIAIVSMLHSPIALSACVDINHRNEATKSTAVGIVPEYVRAVGVARSLAPLQSDVQDLIFHAALLSAQYEEIEAIGDQILRAKGTLRIPFHSNDRFFWVVIDDISKHLRTESSQDPYIVRWDRGRALFNCPNSNIQTNSPRGRQFEELIDFNLDFGSITEVSQQADSCLGDGATLQSGSVALRLRPKGVAPNYVFMNLISCVYGEPAQKTVTRNLGRYLLHLVQNPQVRSSLVDPKEKSSSIGGALMLAGVGVMSTRTGNINAFRTALDAEKDASKRQIDLQSEQSASWEQLTTTDFGLLEMSAAFGSVERLLALEH